MFPCTSCGLCCRHIENIAELNEYDLGNGICKYLNIVDNSCKIYDERPDICRIDKMFDIEFNKHFSKKDFYVKNAEVCNSLQLMYNLDKNYIVNIKEI
ncbi:MAG: YkgJ family cysteine cluster protein [Campylobacterota bacterium]|nr:YkgJ family cysteine cluster protein [Campylobacterota bacterium]